MKEMYKGIVNSPMTELVDDIDATQTTIDIVDGNKLPDAPNIATIGINEDAETILYTIKTGSTLSGITRGFQGVAKAWGEGIPVYRTFTDYDYDTLIKNIETVDGKADGAIKDSEKGAVGGVAKQDDFINHVDNGAAHGIGDKSTLLTANKTTIVGAMNELFTNANNLKDDWATVVGSPLLATDTSAQLKSKTQTIKDTLAANLTAKGIASSGNASLDVLSTRVGQINTGKKWAEGTTVASAGFVTVSGLDFKPSVVICTSTLMSDIKQKMVYAEIDNLGVNISNGNSSTFELGRNSVSADGFVTPGTGGITYKWIAFE